jgi:transposase
MKKSRFFYLHRETNKVKVDALEALYTEYVAYVSLCKNRMLESRVLKVNYLKQEEMNSTFPKSSVLSSNIERNARIAAINLVSSWASAIYQRTLKSHIFKMFKEGTISKETKHQLCVIGKHLVSKPSEKIHQDSIDLYWALLLDLEISGKPPQVGPRFPMRFDTNTCDFEASKETDYAPFWIQISTLVKRKVVYLPLDRNPLVTGAMSKGFMVRKDTKGRWRFESTEKKDHGVPEVDPAKKVGVDVGLNVLAATSDGRLYGANLKPKFDKLYRKLQSVRKNRQRQKLPKDSKRVNRMEGRLSGMIKSFTGNVVNKLVKAYPNHTFVVEDLDLRGCKGSKRFAYRALHQSLSTKVSIRVVNPAYTSQTCPDCGYVSRGNRAGTRFICRSCGSIRHADVVGGINLLRRSEDKQVGLADHHVQVKTILRERYRLRRNSPSDRSKESLPWDLNPEMDGGKPRLTTRALPRKGQAGIASNYSKLNPIKWVDTG